MLTEVRQEVPSEEKQERADILNAQRGDRQAFERVYSRYAAQTYALCLRLLKQPSRAEDAVQDVFIRLWQKLPQYRFESRFATWLHRLTINLVLNEQRKKHWWQNLIPIETQAEDCEPDSDLHGMDGCVI